VVVAEAVENAAIEENIFYSEFRVEAEPSPGTKKLLLLDERSRTRKFKLVPRWLKESAVVVSAAHFSKSMPGASHNPVAYAWIETGARIRTKNV
jgi:hypothetical protein